MNADMNADWIDNLLEIGMGRFAIQTLALINAGANNSPTKCYCGVTVKKWARSCPKCRGLL